MKKLLLVLLLLATPVFAGTREHCVARCERRYPTPTPAPTALPVPTPPPITGCAPMSMVSSHEFATGMQDYQLGEPRCFSFVLPAISGALVEIKTQNETNTSCGIFELEVHTPRGTLPVDPPASQPGAIAISTGLAGKWALVITKDEDCNGKRLSVRAIWPAQ